MGVDPADLVGAAELRVMLGPPGRPMSKQRAWVISRAKGFPEPVATLGQGPIWLRSEVAEWISRNRPWQND
ncbi:hypothetical protein [Micromonospora sp. NBC_01813]|uniref:hypothetical protein n=1 Tax=Micromonospora sp. NBC_01813 TaxID=2975988 RepID=UPI002DDAB081|nr:hypothetical protein [Micromonospora sp. NBC_01813]WSA07082.1 hypothetical protein OG958_22840 [Micromonospora sp. NBC_01813]